MEISIAKIIDKLKENQSEVEIRLPGKGDVRVGLAELTLLVEAIKESKSIIKYIDLRGNDLGYDEIEVLVNGLLSSGKYIEKLHLGRNQIELTGAIKLAQLLMVCANLKSLYLGENKLGNDGCIAISRALRHGSKYLEEIDLKSNGIGKEGLQELARALYYVEGIKEINLAGNSLAAGMSYLGRALEHNRSVQVLHLGNVGLDDAGVEHLAWSLEFGSRVKRLNLSGNLISDVGAGYLANALIVNRQLQYVYLAKNYIGEDGGLAIIDSLVNTENHQIENQAILEIQLDEQHAKAGQKVLSEATMDELKKILVANAELQAKEAAEASSWVAKVSASEEKSISLTK